MTLSFISPEKEKYVFYIYEVFIWEFFQKRPTIHYSPSVQMIGNEVAMARTLSIFCCIKCIL